MARRYTDQQFRDAVADPEVRTIADLCRRLGILPRGGNYESVRSRAGEFGLDLDQLLSGRDDAAPRRPGRRTWTDDQLLEALGDPVVDGYPTLCERLGLQPYHNTYHRLREHAARLGCPIPRAWSTPGARTGPPRGPGGRYFDADALREAVAVSRTRREVLERLGEPVTAWAYRRLCSDLNRDGIDTGHLSANAARAQPLSELLVRGRRVSSGQLRKRLIREGLLEPRCSDCGGREWRSGPIPLELDHINGDRYDNRLENLRLLCPNCHALTPTYRGRNIGRAPVGGHPGAG